MEKELDMEGNISPESRWYRIWTENKVSILVTLGVLGIFVTGVVLSFLVGVLVYQLSPECAEYTVSGTPCAAMECPVCISPNVTLVDSIFIQDRNVSVGHNGFLWFNHQVYLRMAATNNVYPVMMNGSFGFKVVQTNGGFKANGPTFQRTRISGFILPRVFDDRPSLGSKWLTSIQNMKYVGVSLITITNRYIMFTLYQPANHPFLEDVIVRCDGIVGDWYQTMLDENWNKLNTDTKKMIQSGVILEGYTAMYDPNGLLNMTFIDTHANRFFTGCPLVK